MTSNYLFKNTLLFIVHWFTAAFILIFLSSKAIAHNWESKKENKGIASCLITDSTGNIMMIRDQKSNLLYLPGGPIIENDSAKSAASKHVSEDTGFNARVDEELGKIGNHSIFACQLESEKEFVINKHNEKAITAWGNLFASRSVSKPYLIENNRPALKDYAFQNEIELINVWIPLNKPSQFKQIKNGYDALPSYYHRQHEWLVAVRDWALMSESVKELAYLFPSASAFIFPLLFIISLPFFRTYYGFRPLLIYSTGLVYLGLLCIFLNAYWPAPPPFFVDESFIPTGTFMYSFPTNEVTFFSFVFSWVIIQWPKNKFKTRKLIIVIFGSFFVFISAIKTAIYGESYPSAIFLSIILAILSSYLLLNLRRWRLPNRTRALVSARFWFYSTILTYIAAVLNDGAEGIRTYYLVAFCAGVCISLVFLKMMPNYSMTVRSDVRIRYFLTSVIGLLIIFFIAVEFVPEDADQTDIFVFNVFSMFIVPVWLLLIIPRIFHRYFYASRRISRYR